MNLNAIWDSLVEGFYPFGNPEMGKTANELGVREGWATLLWAAWIFDSEPFLTETFMCIRPYASARVIEARFASAAVQGFLVVNLKNEYLCTEKGKHFVEQVVRSGEEAFAHLEPIPPADLQKVLGYTKRLVKATFDTPEPPPKFAMTHYHKKARPGEEAPLVRLILHDLGTLDQYRGAAHIASWELHDIKGYEWSALTSIWRNEANTLDALHKEMGVNIFTRDGISEALHDLTVRGWIEGEMGAYKSTAKGGRIRQESEHMTDRLFFIPWLCLSKSDLEELAGLASQLREGLEQ